MKKQDLPKIIKKNATNKMQESGCCFTSCGGVPRNCSVDESKKYFKEISKKINLQK